MNFNYIQLIEYIDKYNNGEVQIPDEYIQEFLSIQADTLKSRNRKRGTDFRLYLSNVGKPSCQLQYEKLGFKQEKQNYNAALRNAMGNFSEAWLIMMMKAAGLKVENYQKSVYVLVEEDDGDTTRLNGKLDFTLDGRVYDIKTTSKYAFKKYSEKGGIAAISEEDHFGYIAQGFGYARAEDIRFGGWWVINKDNGQVILCEIPDEVYDKYETEAFDLIKNNLKVIKNTNALGDVVRLFEDVEETYYKEPTGNRKLQAICTFCPFRAACWPNAKYLPNLKAKGKAKPYGWYTQYNEDAKD